MFDFDTINISIASTDVAAEIVKSVVVALLVAGGARLLGFLKNVKKVDARLGCMPAWAFKKRKSLRKCAGHEFLLR